MTADGTDGRDAADEASTGGAGGDGEASTDEADGGDGGEAVRVWLVDRAVDNRDLVTLTYATPDGERAFERVLALAVLNQGGGVTAARTVDAERLDPVEAADRRERYAEEATRMADQHAPEDTV
jgi:hypothetical protein